MSDATAGPTLAATLLPLVGTWSGEGVGDYPTIEPFAYRETVTFETPGRPFLVYRQRTWDTDGAPLHTEAGYLRAPNADTVELVLAQPTGIAEVHTGPATLDDARLVLDLRALAVARTPTAKPVDTVHRLLVVEGDVLRYELEMAAVGHNLTWHLRAELHRVDRSGLRFGGTERDR